jgi:hypothetical protein
MRLSPASNRFPPSGMERLDASDAPSFPGRRVTNMLLAILLFASALVILYAAPCILLLFVFVILFACLINSVARFLQRHSPFFKNLRGPHVVETAPRSASLESSLAALRTIPSRIMAASVKLQTTVSLLPSRGFQLELPEAYRVPYSIGFLATCGVNATSHESARQLPVKSMGLHTPDVGIREGKNSHSHDRGEVDSTGPQQTNRRKGRFCL